MRKKNMKTYGTIYSIAFSFFLTSCHSTTNSYGPLSKHESDTMLQDHEKRVTALEGSVTILNLDNAVSKKIISSLQNDLQSQKEEIATQKKILEVLKRGIRSGIFDELPEEISTNNATDTTNIMNSTMLPDLVNGRSGFSGNQDDSNLPSDSKLINNNDNPVGAKELLANAEIKIRKAEFKQGLIKLNELKKNFPNFEDNGRSFLLTAEAWLKLKEYDNVIPQLRSFYLKYPTSADLAYAKLLEGQANEGNGSFEKAAALYNEVISLSPQSTLAESARNGMLRMRDQK